MYTKHFEFYSPLSLGRPFPEVFFQKNVKKRPTNQTPRHHRFLFQKQQKQLVRSASPRRTSKNIQIFTHLHFNSINHEQGGVKFHSWVPWLRIQMGRDGKVFPEKAHSGRGGLWDHGVIGKGNPGIFDAGLRTSASIFRKMPDPPFVKVKQQVWRKIEEF